MKKVNLHHYKEEKFFSQFHYLTGPLQALPKRILVKVFVFLNRRQEALVRRVIVRKRILLVQDFLPNFAGQRIVVRKPVFLANLRPRLIVPLLVRGFRSSYEAVRSFAVT